MMYSGEERGTQVERHGAHRAGMGVIFVAAAACLLAATLLAAGIGIISVAGYHLRNSGLRMRTSQ